MNTENLINRLLESSAAAVQTRCYNVRAVVEKNRIRVRVEGAGHKARYVQCSREWRESLERGAEFTIRAKMRADGECYVMQDFV